ncbi:hypothetical protein AMS68_006035 [Peltaster fructicola]|uniref:Uncharacterized protein n=1 Tax=Peltaster fructicola TaxID=286661 RepID=A0A6H0Y0Z7_9PEZI|nr:hypothetical protein AMS68_006035 [Peltaster fructicola]
MDAKSPRSLFFAAPESPRRPPSRASSTGTEVPGVPRTLAREVEHIKSLVSRADLTAKANAGSITATIFRSRQEPSITQAHILHELDILKRRIKAETRPTPKRQLDDDPETETESEPDDVVDERDEELDSIREELQLVREQREKWIEAAEDRVDRLTDEKDALLEQLETQRQELVTAHKKEESLLASQRDHDTTIAELKSTHAKQFHKLKDTQLKNVERERDSALKSLEDKDSYIESLEQDVEGLKVELNEEHQAAVNKERAEQATQAELKRQHTQELNYVRRSADLGLSQARAQAEQQAGEIRRNHEQELSIQSEKHDTVLAALRSQHDTALVALHNEHDTALSKSQSDYAATTADLRAQHVTELQHQQELAATELSSANSAHQSKLMEQQQQHEEALRAIEAERQASEAALVQAHETTLESLRIESADAQKDIQATHESAINALNDKHSSAMSQAEDDHRAEIAKAQQMHSQEAERLRTDRELALKATAEGAADRTDRLIAELDKRHEAQREQWQQELNSLREELKLKLQSAQQKRESSLATLEAQHTNRLKDKDTELEKLRLEHVDKTAALRQQYLEERETTAKQNDSLLREMKEGYVAQIAEHERAHEALIEDTERRISTAFDQADKRCDVLKEAHIANLHNIQSTHEEDCAKIALQHQEEIKWMKDTHVAALEATSRSHLDALNDLQLKHHETISEMQEQISKVNANLAVEHEHHQGAQLACASYEQQFLTLRDELAKMQASSAEAAKTSEERLQKEHELQLQTLRDDHFSSKTDTEAKHQDVLRRALEEAARSAQLRSQEHHKVLHDQLDATARRLHTKHASDLESVKSEHTRDMIDMRTQLVTTREELERSRQDYANLSTLHANEVAQLFSDHKAALAKLKADRPESSGTLSADLERAATATTTTETTANNIPRDETKKAEELQQQIASLNAEILEHHQARNHLEGMLQQKTHEAIQATEEAKLVQRKHSVLESELKNLRTTHERTETSLRELQETILEHQDLSTGESTRMEEELEGLRKQIDSAVLEKAAVQSDIISKSTERSELAMQNDFLSKQLAELGTHMSSRSKSKYADRGMQTAPRIEVLGGSPKRGTHRRNTSLPVEVAKESNGQIAPTKSKRGSILFGPELSNSIVGSPLAKSSQQVDSRPSTPDNPIVSAMVTPGSRRSIHDYLQKSETALFEPGSVATANEALLSRMIREHVGDMQKARDSLAKEYQARFDALLREKERLDRKVTMEQAADFVKEREDIASKFISNEQQEVIAGANQPGPRQTAEQRLVQKYNRRINKKKSQIRLQHAEDFHNLTQDYDRRLADLLFQKSEMEGDLDFGQSDLNGETDDTAKPSEPVKEVADAARTTITKRSLSSIPKASGIPRMASFTREPDVLQVVKPRVDRSTSSEGRAHPPVRQRSLMRLKSPPEGPPTRRSIDGDTPLKPLASEHPDSDYAGDADEFDKHGRGLKRQTGSPNIKASVESPRVTSIRINDRRPSSSSERNATRAAQYMIDLERRKMSLHDHFLSSMHTLTYPDRLHLE